MPSVHGDYFVGNHTVSPFRSIGNGCPNEDHSTLAHECLPPARIVDLSRQLGIGLQKAQFVVHRQIPVKPGFQSVHSVYEQIGFKGMS